MDMKNFLQTQFVINAILLSVFPIVTGNFGPGFVEFNGNGYFASSTKLDFYESNADCIARGATLTSVHCLAEHNFLRQLIFDTYGSSKSVLIGGNDIGTEGVWTWISTNETLDYTNWRDGQPNGLDAENCVIMFQSTDMTWSDKSCDSAYYYICKQVGTNTGLNGTNACATSSANTTVQPISTDTSTTTTTDLATTSDKLFTTAISTTTDLMTTTDTLTITDPSSTLESSTSTDSSTSTSTSTSTDSSTSTSSSTSTDSSTSIDSSTSTSKSTTTDSLTSTNTSTSTDSLTSTNTTTTTVSSTTTDSSTITYPTTANNSPTSTSTAAEESTSTSTATIEHPPTTTIPLTSTVQPTTGISSIEITTAYADETDSTTGNSLLYSIVSLSALHTEMTMFTTKQDTIITSQHNSLSSIGSTEAGTGNTSSATVKTGTCECQHINKQVNWTQKALDDVLEQLRNDLLIPKKSTSKALRKLKCADDGRPSSRTIGYIGIIVLAFLWVLLVFSDILSIVQYIDKRSKI